MLTVSGLNKSFNLQTLFTDVHFSLHPGERVGLIGPNGSGKSTLLRILAGLDHPTSGQVTLPAGWRVGYLPQDFPFNPQDRLEDVIGRASDDPAALESELAEVAFKLAGDPLNTQLSAHYDQLLQRIQNSQSGDRQAILKSLDLDTIPPDIPVGILSGGQKTRLSLALMLLSDPHILLLDEPTNHLDVEMLEWMEAWLCCSDAGALIASHDRTFLDNAVTRILEIDAAHQRICAYEGNFSAYTDQKESEFHKQVTAYKDQNEEITRMRADIARAREQARFTERQASSVRIGGPEMRITGYKSHQQSIAKKVAKKAKARQKRLERYLESRDRVERPKESRPIRLQFQETPYLNRSVMQLEGLNVGYSADNVLLKDLNLQMYREQRISISGPNGSGKTTLLRTLAGQIAPLGGKIQTGASVHIGLIDQEVVFSPQQSSALSATLPFFSRADEARHFLAAYHIFGEDAIKPVGQLSIGQQKRLQLAILVARRCNLLLLDEPMNHLDIPSRQQFESALGQFSGCVVAVVHDRYFIERFSHVVWYIHNRQIVATG